MSFIDLGLWYVFPIHKDAGFLRCSSHKNRKRVISTGRYKTQIMNHLESRNTKKRSKLSAKIHEKMNK